ncbi:alpha-2-macroglobulin, partial [Thermodesulfobacteriota bacterium]
TQIVLRWDGKPVGSEQTGERSITVPAVGDFHVLQARAVQGDEQYIEVRFSDPLKKQQNLRGLIRIDGIKKLKFNIEGNIVRVYSPSRWNRELTIRVETGIRNATGHRLKKVEELKVFFQEIKPQVRFAGKGIIIPNTEQLTIPIETVNLRAVVVEAMRIYEKNIPQFLQVNDLGGDKEIKRVGRVVWKKTIPLEFTPDKQNHWIRYGLEVSPLLQKYDSGIFRIQLSFKRRHIVYDCADSADGQEGDADKDTLENLDEEEQESNWNAYEDNENYSHWELYQSRQDPCHPGYYLKYYDHNITVARNVLVSDIGLIAKRGSGNAVFVAATDIQTAKPLPEVELTLLDYQQQVLVQGKTDENGTASLDPERKPFLAVAKRGDQRGYLKLDDGSALSVSHFDVSGTKIRKGIKGYIYGERGVWRPGDPIYLTFVLMDSDNRLPDDHPVSFELRNPRGQLIEKITKKQSLNGFYCFKTATDPDAPTGNWHARIRVGGAVFEKILKIETVMPNRLKINLDFGKEVKSLSGGTINAELSATWLHGAIAKYLESEVDVTFTASKTIFPKYQDYVFDDPTRKYNPEEQRIFEGKLGAKGKVSISDEIRTENVSPGMLKANFRTRVFEPGGAFSVDRFSMPYHPYRRYVGIRAPKGDKARGMLLTDTDHKVNIIMLDAKGNIIPEGRIELELYKIKWRWWWEKGQDSLADYVGSSSHRPILSDTVRIQNGKAAWTFAIKYPQWGRYLIRARDLDGKHSTGKIVYMDWPGWAGRAQKDMPGGATILSFSADKEEYTVGETVMLTIPTGQQGITLVSLESGSKLLKTSWIDAGKEPTRFEFTATPEMSPNVYVHVTFLQPHLQAGNDLPIRMYGVIPIKIVDPHAFEAPHPTAGCIRARGDGRDIRPGRERKADDLYGGHCRRRPVGSNTISDTGPMAPLLPERSAGRKDVGSVRHGGRRIRRYA